jgi:hypothetical protein
VVLFASLYCANLFGHSDVVFDGGLKNMIEAVKDLLLEQNINPASTIEYDVNGNLHVFSLEEIASAYMQASDESKAVFVQALEKALRKGKIGVQSYFEKMGQLLLMSTLSDKFET